MFNTDRWQVSSAKVLDTIVQWTKMSIQMNEDSGLNAETIFGMYILDIQYWNKGELDKPC